MQSLQEKLEYLREKIEGKIAHPFLSQNFAPPEIDRDKLLLLVSVLDYMNISHHEMEQFAIPTTLLQLALDTHEQVTNELNGYSNFKNRQLTVLAGTYYSGLYYKMLADYHEIDVIRILAEGVETINDQKIIVYEKEMDGIDLLMDSIQKIESSLYKKLTAYLHASHWDDVIENFLLIRRLMKEKDAFIAGNSSIIFECLRKIVFPKKGGSIQELSIEQKNYLMLICDRYIDFAKQLLLKGKGRLPRISNILEERIYSLLEGHRPLAKSLVEEG